MFDASPLWVINMKQNIVLNSNREKNKTRPLLSAFTLFQLNVSAEVKIWDIEWILKWKIKDITEELLKVMNNGIFNQLKPYILCHYFSNKFYFLWFDPTYGHSICSIISQKAKILTLKKGHNSCSIHTTKDSQETVSWCMYYVVSKCKTNCRLKDITQWWTLIELCHEIITVTAIHVVRPCSTDNFS